MGRSIAAIAVGIARIIVSPGRIGANGVFKQCAEVVEQGLLPFIHKYGSSGMKRLHEDHAFPNTAFSNEFLHLLSQVDQFESIPGRVVEHMSNYYWRGSGAERLRDVFRPDRFKLRFHGLLYQGVPSWA